MNWIKRLLLINEKRIRRKQVSKQIIKCENKLNKELSDQIGISQEILRIEGLEARIHDLNRELIELDYKDINEKIYELD